MSTITRIRKEVALLANKINKTAKNLSSAFKRAWMIVKGRKLVTKLSGVTFGTRQKALARLEKYSREEIQVTLEREPGNQYDKNAVRVLVNVAQGAKYHLGYIPSEIASTLSVLLDKGLTLASRFISVTGGYEGRETRGCMIVVEL